MDPPRRMPSHQPLPPGPTVGIPHSAVKVVWSTLGMGCFSVVLLACGGIINPRWVGWFLIAFGVIAVIFAVAELRQP